MSDVAFVLLTDKYVEKPFLITKLNFLMEQVGTGDNPSILIEPSPIPEYTSLRVGTVREKNRYFCIVSSMDYEIYLEITNWEKDKLSLLLFYSEDTSIGCANEHTKFLFDKEIPPEVVKEGIRRFQLKVLFNKLQ